jgi:hypothetical protein
MAEELRFLESIDNLRPRVKRRFGREPNTTTAREIVACLLQGRLFYEAAASSPLEIRPLQLFYGMVGFAKALVIASRCTSLSTLHRAHGLKDISAEGCQIAELRVRITDDGTFQEFNDVMAGLTRFCYLDGTQPCAISTPAATADALTGLSMSLRELLSRIPGLAELYQKTFGEAANTASILIDNSLVGKWRIRIDDPELFTNRKTLRLIVTRWRSRFPLLDRWRLVEASHAWGNSVIILENASAHGLDEFAAMALLDLGNSFMAAPHAIRPEDHFPFDEYLPAMGGGYTGDTIAISPFQGHYISEFALHYLALFVLSSLVRYRPQTWMHAISRSSTAQAPADDTALSLIENFLVVNSGTIPTMVVTMFNPQEDRYFLQKSQQPSMTP